MPRKKAEQTSTGTQKTLSFAVLPTASPAPIAEPVLQTESPNPPQLVIIEEPQERPAPAPAPAPAPTIEHVPPVAALSPQEVPAPAPAPPAPLPVRACADCAAARQRYDALKQTALDRENELLHELAEVEDDLEQTSLILSQVRLPEDVVEFINEEYMWNPRKEPEEPTLNEKLASILASYKKVKTWYAKQREEKEVLEVRIRQYEKHIAYLESVLEESD